MEDFSDRTDEDLRDMLANLHAELQASWDEGFLDAMEDLACEIEEELRRREFGRMAQRPPWDHDP